MSRRENNAATMPRLARSPPLITIPLEPPDPLPSPRGFPPVPFGTLSSTIPPSLGRQKKKLLAEKVSLARDTFCPGHRSSESFPGEKSTGFLVIFDPNLMRGIPFERNRGNEALTLLDLVLVSLEEYVIN